MELAIEAALQEAESGGVSGSDVRPVVLLHAGGTFFPPLCVHCLAGMSAKPCENRQCLPRELCRHHAVRKPHADCETPCRLHVVAKISSICCLNPMTRQEDSTVACASTAMPAALDQAFSLGLAGATKCQDGQGPGARAGDAVPAEARDGADGRRVPGRQHQAHQAQCRGGRADRGGTPGRCQGACRGALTMPSGACTASAIDIISCVHPSAIDIISCVHPSAIDIISCVHPAKKVLSQRFVACILRKKVLSQRFVACILRKPFFHTGKIRKQTTYKFRHTQPQTRHRVPPCNTVHLFAKKAMITGLKSTMSSPTSTSVAASDARTNFL